MYFFNSEFKLTDKSDYSKITFYELWTQYRDYKKIHLKAQSFRSVESRIILNQSNNKIYTRYNMKSIKKAINARKIDNNEAVNTLTNGLLSSQKNT